MFELTNRWALVKEIDFGPFLYRNVVLIVLFGPSSTALASIGSLTNWLTDCIMWLVSIVSANKMGINE